MLESEGGVGGGKGFPSGGNTMWKSPVVEARCGSMKN